MLYNELDNPKSLKLPFLLEGPGPLSSRRLLGPTQVYPPIGISISSEVFAEPTNVSRTHRQSYTVCSNTSHLAITAMWPNYQSANHTFFKMCCQIDHFNIKNAVELTEACLSRGDIVYMPSQADRRCPAVDCSRFHTAGDHIGDSDDDD